MALYTSDVCALHGYITSPAGGLSFILLTGPASGLDSGCEPAGADRFQRLSGAVGTSGLSWHYDAGLAFAGHNGNESSYIITCCH